MDLTYQTIKEAILSQSLPEKASFAARYFKANPGQYGEGDQFVGLSMPQQHTLARQFRQLPVAETEQLVRDPFHECRMVGLLIWVYQFKQASDRQRTELVEYYLANRQHINNWDLVDATCPHILGQHVVRGDRAVLYELADEPYLWSQRMALVATLTLIRKQQFADTFMLTERLLTHQHPLIHKAIGWMLREIGKRSLDALEEFLHDHIQQLPRTTLRYAIERLSPVRRQYYLAL